MPRFVRPSFLTATADGIANGAAIGPKSRTGELTATLSVRSDGSVLQLLSIDAIASKDGATVLVRVTDKRTGLPLFEERFAQ
jgi:hypothetical protein